MTLTYIGEVSQRSKPPVVYKNRSFNKQFLVVCSALENKKFGNFVEKLPKNLLKPKLKQDPALLCENHFHSS